MKKTAFRYYLSLLVLFSLLLTINKTSYSQSYRDRKIQPDRVMDVIGVKEGMVIGEAGAGRGYFTLKLAERVGEKGKIYANDISEKELGYLKRDIKRNNIKNIEIIVGEEEDPLFPDGKMDMVFMCYVFHEIKKPVEFLENVKADLKPGAKVVILDRDTEKNSSYRYHFLSKKETVNIIKKTSYKLERIETFLEEDNIYILSPQKNRDHF